MTSDGSKEPRSLPGLTAEEAAELAKAHGLKQVGIRPNLGDYVRQSWQRRRFLWTLATSQAVSKHQNNYLGQIWAVLNPVLLAVAYWLVFGLLLDTRDGTENYIAFLTSGIFTFVFISTTLTSGSRAVLRNTGLVRALRFPRCLLPLSIGLAELVAALPAFAVLVIIVVATGETASWSWALLPIALIIIFMMVSGLAMIGSRVLETSRDLGNLIPVIVRLLRYISGVFFSIEAYAGTGLIGNIMYFQPIATAMTMVRQSLIGEYEPNLVLWLVAAGWGILLFTTGFILFWQAEAKYGRG